MPLNWNTPSCGEAQKIPEAINLKGPSLKLQKVVLCAKGEETFPSSLQVDRSSRDTVFWKPGHPQWGELFRDTAARVSYVPLTSSSEPPPIRGDNFLLCHWCRIWSKRCLLSSPREVPQARKGMERGIREEAEGRREKARRGDSSSLYDHNMHTKLSVIVGSLTNSIQEELVALMLCQNNGSALNYKMFKNLWLWRHHLSFWGREDRHSRSHLKAEPHGTRWLHTVDQDPGSLATTFLNTFWSLPIQVSAQSTVPLVFTMWSVPHAHLSLVDVTLSSSSSINGTSLLQRFPWATSSRSPVQNGITQIRFFWLHVTSVFSVSNYTMFRYSEGGELRHSNSQHHWGKKD